MIIQVINHQVHVIIQVILTIHFLNTGIKDLRPDNGSLTEKFLFNAFNGANTGGNTVGHQIKVALRIARVRHSCQPNASTIYDETAHVAILYALTDIQPGEDVTFCYLFAFFNLLSDGLLPGTNPEWSIRQQFDFCNANLPYSTPGIICPAECPCHDTAFLALVPKGRKMHESLVNLALQGKIKEALVVGEKILDIHRRLNVTWIYRGLTEFSLFQLAVRKSETLPRAKEYIRSAVELFKQICPYSERFTKRYERFLEQPEMHPDYLKMDME